MTVDSARFLAVQVANRVAVVTINHPPVNAMNVSLLEELSRVFADLAAAPMVGAIVVTGAGRAFMAGADLKAVKDFSIDEFQRFVGVAQRTLDNIESCPLPTIAALNGATLGGGLELALACDLRFASTSATLGVPEVNLGLIPAAGGTQRLSRVVTKGKALELLYCGSVLSAEQAYELGIVERVLSNEDLLPTSVEFGAELALRPPAALRAAKGCVLAGRDYGLAAGLRAEVNGVVDLFVSADTQEGISAFLERRPAAFPTVLPSSTSVPLSVTECHL